MSDLRRGSVASGVGSQMLHPAASRVRRPSQAGSSFSSFSSPARRSSVPAAPWNANTIFDLDERKEGEAAASGRKGASKKRRERRSRVDFGDEESDSVVSEEDNEGGYLGPRPRPPPCPHADESMPEPTPAPIPTARTRTPPPPPAVAAVASSLIPTEPAPCPPVPVSVGVGNGLWKVDEDEGECNADPSCCSPSLDAQRALLCASILRKHRCFNVMDAGCSDGGLLRRLVHSQLVERSLRNVVGIDLSRDSLSKAETRLLFPPSSPAEYLHRVRVELVLGDLTLPPPLVHPFAHTSTEDAKASASRGAAEYQVPTQRRPWLQMDRHYARLHRHHQHQQQQPDVSATTTTADGRRCSVSRDSVGGAQSCNDVSSNFDDSPTPPPNPNSAPDEDVSSALLTAGLSITPYQPMDAVLSIEVLQRIPPHLVSCFTDTVFAQLAALRGARVVVLTTPNRSENTRFESQHAAAVPGSSGTTTEGKKGRGKQKSMPPAPERSIFNPATGQPTRRHPGHLFELTAAQFKAYCEYVLAYYGAYWDAYELVDVGEGYTQGAVFISSAARQAMMQRHHRHRHSTHKLSGCHGASSAANSATVSGMLSNTPLSAAGHAESSGGVGTDKGLRTVLLSAQGPPPVMPPESLVRWDFKAEDGVASARGAGNAVGADGGRALPSARGTGAVGPALPKGRRGDPSLRKRVANKAAAASRQSVGGKGQGGRPSSGAASKPSGGGAAASAKPRKTKKAGGPAGRAGRPPREGSSGSTKGRTTSTGSGVKGRKAPAGRRSAPPKLDVPEALSARTPPRDTTTPETGPASSGADLDDDHHRWREPPKSLSGYATRWNREQGEGEGAKAQGELDFDATLVGTLGGSVAASVRPVVPYTWSFSREERLEAFPFEEVFGMSERAYRSEFRDFIAAVDRGREARVTGSDPAFVGPADSMEDYIPDATVDDGMDSEMRRHTAHRSSPSIAQQQQPQPQPQAGGGRVNTSYGYLSMRRLVLPATGLWDRLCDSVFHSARSLYGDLLSACYVSRHGGISGGGGGWSSGGGGGGEMLTREGVFFGELVLRRERTTAFKALHCTVCAVLAMLEEQRRLWYKNFLSDLRRWYCFARVRRIPPNSAFTMLSGLINEVLPSVKQISYSAAASWANALPADCIAIPNSAAYSALKTRPPADQSEGSSILKDLRLSQSGVRVHTWLLEEILRLAIAHRRRGGNGVGVGNGNGGLSARGVKAETVTAEDVIDDDETRLDTFLPDDVALVLLFMAAVDALPKASAWMRERVPRWSPATTVGSDAIAALHIDSSRGTGRRMSQRTNAGMSDAEFDLSVSVSRRRRLLRQQEERLASPRSVMNTARRSVGKEAISVMGSYSVGSSSGLVGVVPSSNAALQLASSVSTFRVDNVILEHLLGPPEDYITVEY